MSPEAQGTPLANVLSDTPIGRLGDFDVNKITNQTSRFLA